MADLKLLATLKDKLIHGKDFSEVTRYFFDHFGVDESFLALGEPTRHPFLETVVNEVAAQMFGARALAEGKNALIISVLLTRLPEYDFIHGGLTIAGQVGTIFYFEEEGVGLMIVAMPPPSTETKFARFRGQKLRRPAEPSVN